MALDLENLHTAVVSRINAATGTASALNNKCWLDVVADGTQWPYVVISAVADARITQGYASVLPGRAIDDVLIQFAVYSPSKATAVSLMHAVAALFEGKPVVLTGQANIHVLQRTVFVKREARSDTAIVYRAAVQLSFFVQTF